MMQLLGFFLAAVGIIGMGVSLKRNGGVASLKKLLSFRGKTILAAKIKQWMKGNSAIQALKPQNWIKKTLLKAKIFFLKCENKIDSWLKKVSQSKKFNSDYWENLKKK